MKKRVGVVLSGCGVYDGSEIHEAVFTLLAIDRCGAEAVCMAPDMEFAEVNHLTGAATGAKRNVLTESARIARGKIMDLKAARADNLDAVIFPGGYGAAKNLCTFAEKGAEAAIHPEVARLAGTRATGAAMRTLSMNSTSNPRSRANWASSANDSRSSTGPHSLPIAQEPKLMVETLYPVLPSS